MAFILGTLAAKLLDPASIVIVLFVILCSKQKWIIPVAGVIAAIIVETILTSMQVTRSWGQGLFFGLSASLIHAVLIYWMVSQFRKKENLDQQVMDGEKNGTERTYDEDGKEYPSSATKTTIK